MEVLASLLLLRRTSDDDLCPAPCKPAGKYESAPKLLQLVRHAESDAWLALGLAFYLSVLPLTRQLVGARERSSMRRWLCWQGIRALPSCLNCLHCLGQRAAAC